MKLTALRANNPVAVMAAYGALRLLPGARLRWVERYPELDWEGDVIAELARQLPQRRQSPEVTALDDPRDKNIGGLAGYRLLAGRIPTGWLVAYGSESPDGICASGLLLVGGGHKFVANARAVMDDLAQRDVDEKLKEALIGPWRYADHGPQAWGWDAATRIDAAASPKSVENTPKVGVMGAYWLAWEALPFWPIINQCTVGMTRGAWVYPTCSEWLDAKGLSAMILSAPRLSSREIESLGIKRWSAAILKSGKYGKALGWARPGHARTSIVGRNPGRFAPA